MLIQGSAFNLPLPDQSVNSLEPEALVDRLRAHSKAFTLFEEGWIHGTWYCSTAFRKAIYYGQYPATFVTRITRAFPTNKFRLLHLCCGRCRVDGAVNVDIKRLPEADAVADGERLPFADNAFDVLLVDPPYSEEDASRYGVRRLINSRQTVREAERVLVDGGWLCWLDEKYPMVSRKQAMRLRGLIGIVTGFERRTRILSMFRKEIKGKAPEEGP